MHAGASLRCKKSAELDEVPMEEKLHFKLRPLRTINYLILVAFYIFLYSVLQNYFLFTITVVIVISPILSAAGSVYMSKRLKVELGIGKNSLVSGEEILLELRLQNPTWFPALQSRISLFLSNTFLENRVEWSAEMPVKIHDMSVLRLPLTFVNLGRFAIKCDTLELQDAMGLLIIKKPIDLSGEVYVLPDGNAGIQPDVTNFITGAAEVEESKHKGNDFSEVSDIREYAAGDRIRDIHWKLSARQDKLMVKERVATAGSEMVMFLNLVKNDELTQQILELGFRYAKSFMQQRMPVCILCWNQAEFCFEEHRCAADEELVHAYSEIYQTPLSGRVNEEWAKFLSNSFPYLQSYLRIGVRDGIAGVEMCEN